LGAPDDVITTIADDGGSLAHMLRFAKETLQEGYLEEIGGEPVSHENRPFLRYLISELGPLREEVLLAVYLDGGDRYLGQEIVARGTKIALAIETRRLLRSAVERNAYGLIIAHNHPSGHPHPSPSDITATAAARVAAEHIGIRLVDHLIIAGSVAFSMKRSGQL
jgi:DNA repair protein RadC